MQKPNKRMLGAILFSILLITASVFLITIALGAAPAISQIMPDNEDEFIDTNDGDGANWTVNITDADGDLEIVRLLDNASNTFYDSGSLGGVYYHNITGQNSNWTGSWEFYEWQIASYDGTWHNSTHNFTTAYQWGVSKMTYYDDFANFDFGAEAYKNTTNDYYMYLFDSTNRDASVITSNTGSNWSVVGDSFTDVYTTCHPDQPSGSWAWFTYDNMSAFFFIETTESDRGYYRIGRYNGASWETVQTSIWGKGWSTLEHGYTRIAVGGDIIYYDNTWQLVIGALDNHQTNSMRLRWYTGTPWTSWSFHENILTKTVSGATGDILTYYTPSMAVLGGTLVLIYKDLENDLHWRTYDGVAWTDEGDVQSDIGLGCSVTKDEIHDQLVCVYIDNGTGIIKYRVLEDAGGSWSEEYTVFDPGSYDTRFPQVYYIDSRVHISFSYNARGGLYPWNIYTIVTPDYTELSGLDQYNRIIFSDTLPGSTHVNSTAFTIKNVDNRDIATIQFHFEDMGQINASGNMKIWSNMGGSWQGWLCDSNGDTAEIDISAVTGSEWIPGETFIFRLEIIDTGMVDEDLHTSDSMFYKITFV